MIRKISNKKQRKIPKENTQENQKKSQEKNTEKCPSKKPEIPPRKIPRKKPKFNDKRLMVILKSKVKLKGQVSRPHVGLNRYITWCKFKNDVFFRRFGATLMLREKFYKSSP